jgi:hypothetical protein
MAFTQSDLDSINSAIASGVSLVRFADARETRYPSMADLKSAKAVIEAELGVAGGATKRIRQVRMYSDKGF